MRSQHINSDKIMILFPMMFDRQLLKIFTIYIISLTPRFQKLVVNWVSMLDEMSKGTQLRVQDWTSSLLSSLRWKLTHRWSLGRWVASRRVFWLSFLHFASEFKNFKKLRILIKFYIYFNSFCQKIIFVFFSVFLKEIAVFLSKFSILHSNMLRRLLFVKYEWRKL